jgi:hypothetical protein
MCPKTLAGRGLLTILYIVTRQNRQFYLVTAYKRGGQLIVAISGRPCGSTNFLSGLLSLHIISFRNDRFDLFAIHRLLCASVAK